MEYKFQINVVKESKRKVGYNYTYSYMARPSLSFEDHEVLKIWLGLVE